MGIFAGGVRVGLSFTAGLIGMYLLYEVLHRRAHTHPPRGGYGRWLRKSHFAHHFGNPRRAHGVTTPIWDVVFGTLLPVDRVPVPRRMAMLWLVDEAGQLRESFAADYTLVGKAQCDAETRRADADAAMANRSPI
ncbi:MAG: hypothetical protein GY725_21420 [bacterium]|nr:hypothetical protein [bacterium]